MIASRMFRTDWGWMGVAASAAGLRMLVLPVTNKERVRHVLRASLNGASPPRRLGTGTDPSLLVVAAEAQVAEFLEGTRQTFALPIDLATGSPFQRRVWRAILRIPFGRVRSYQWVAAHVGGRQYARAVGHALGANPIPIVVPCHRVVTSSGALGGFSGGLHNKRRLLELEGTLAQLRATRR